MTVPSNDTKLWEELRRLFGVGDWSELSGEPYHEYVRSQVGKMKRWREKRKVSIETLYLTALWCHARSMTIEDPFELLKHAKSALAALKASKNPTAARREGSLDEAVALALSRERSLAVPDEEWLGQLLRAQGDYRKVVLAEWARSYQSRTGSPSGIA